MDGDYAQVYLYRVGAHKVVKKQLMTLSLPKGFSLIELVVVIGLLSLLILAVSSTMLMSVISSGRIRNLTKIKQAGNYALGQMQLIIRNARSIITCDPDANTLTTLNPNGDNTLYSLEDGRISSGSGIYLTPSDLEVTSLSIVCEPSSTAPSLVKIAFDLKNIANTRDNSSLHFETGINLRND